MPHGWWIETPPTSPIRQCSRSRPRKRPAVPTTLWACNATIVVAVARQCGEAVLPSLLGTIHARWHQTTDSNEVAARAPIDVVVTPLAAAPEIVRASAALLSDAARYRARRFVFDRDTRRFIVARARLRKSCASRIRLVTPGGGWTVHVRLRATSRRAPTGHDFSHAASPDD